MRLVGRYKWAAGLVVLGITLPYWLLHDSFWLSVGTEALVYMAAASAWNILSGFGGQTSFGNSIFFGIGAYCVALLPVRHGWNPWLALLAGAVLAVVVSVVIGGLMFRTRGIYFALGTFALTLILQILAEHYQWITGGDVGITSSAVSGGLAELYMSAAAYYYAALILVVIVVFVAHRVLHSTLGLSLRSVRDDERAAAACGVRIFKVKVVGFAITAGLTALAGGLYFEIVGFIDPTSAFGQTVATEIAVLAIVGGGGTLAGPIVGAVILVPLQQALGSGGLVALPNGLSLVIYGAIIVGILWWDPRGMVHLARAGRGLVVSRTRRSASEEDTRPSGASPSGAGHSMGPSQASPPESPPGRAPGLEGETAGSSLGEGDVRLGRENG